MGWIRTRKSKGPASEVRTPVARTDELVVEQVGDEVLIYDQRTHDAHCLSAAAGQVWHACDGRTPREQLAGRLGLGAGTIEHALEELDRCRLLDGASEPGLTRRQVTSRFVKAGAAAAAAPLIYSIVSPVPAAAQSVNQCFMAGSNCGSNPNGCLSVPGCCCCHGSSLPMCSSDPQHCCLPAATCTSTGGHCSSGGTATSTAAHSAQSQSTRSSAGTSGALSQPSTGGAGRASGTGGGSVSGGAIGGANAGGLSTGGGG